MTETDQLLEHLRENEAVEVDHALTVYIEPTMRLPWRDTEKIRELGYKIQDITNGEHQTEITLVKNNERT